MQSILAGELDTKLWSVNSSMEAKLASIARHTEAISSKESTTPRPPESTRPTPSNPVGSRGRNNLSVEPPATLTLALLNKIFFEENQERHFEVPFTPRATAASGSQINAKTATHLSQKPNKGRNTNDVHKPVHQPNNSKVPTLYAELDDFVRSAIEDMGNQQRDGDMFARLQIYQEAFQRYIDEFVKYQPFLSAVKYEYDNVIDSLREQIRSSFNTQTELASTKESHIMEMRNMQTNYETKIILLNGEKDDIRKQIAHKDKTIRDLSYDIARLKESTSKALRECDENRASCLTLTHALQRFEDDKKNYLIQEALRKQDLMETKLAEQKGVDEIERLRQMMQELEAQHSTMVSHDVVDELKDRSARLEYECETLNKEHKSLIERYSTIKSAIEVAFAQINPAAAATAAALTKKDANKAHKMPAGSDAQELISKIEEFFQRGEPPRILIEVMAGEIEDLKRQVREGAMDSGVTGGLKQIGSSSSSKSQDDGGAWGLEDASHIKDVVFTTPWAHFTGLGFDESVPSYKRINGKVQNVFMSKKEVISVIHELFQTSLPAVHGHGHSHGHNHGHNQDSSLEGGHGHHHHALGDTTTFPKKFETFLEMKFTPKFKAIEAAYNILDAANRFSNTSDCKIFLMILNGELPEDSWTDMLGVMEELQKEVAKDVAVANRATMHGSSSMQERNKLPVDHILRTIKKIFTGKSDLALKRITMTIQMENKSSRFVNPSTIFHEGENGDRGRVSELLRLQYIVESAEFDKRVSDLINKAREPGTNEALLSKVREALLHADPNKSRPEVNQWLARGCGVTVEEALLIEAKKELIPIEPFQKKLRKELLKKSDPDSKLI